MTAKRLIQQFLAAFKVAASLPLPPHGIPAPEVPGAAHGGRSSAAAVEADGRTAGATERALRVTGSRVTDWERTSPTWAGPASNSGV